MTTCNCWLDLFTGTTCEGFLDAGGEVSGFRESRWIVMDYNDVLVHIFHPELRQRYALEDLWGDAKRVK